MAGSNAAGSACSSTHAAPVIGGYGERRPSAAGHGALPAGWRSFAASIATTVNRWCGPVAVEAVNQVHGCPSGREDAAVLVR